MKHILAVFVMAVFVLSVFSVSILAEGNNAPYGAGNQDSGQPGLYNDSGEMGSNEPEVTGVNTQNQVIDTRLRVCVDFMQKNRLSRTPLETCQKMFREELRCQEYLEGLGVEEAEAKCGRLFQEGAQIIKERAYVAQQVTQAVAEWRLKRADGLIEKNPAAETVLQALSEEKAKVFMHLTRARQKEIVQLGKEKAVEVLNGLRLQKVQKNMISVKRQIAAEKLQEAKQNFEKAKNEYTRLNGLYNQKRSQFMETKEDLGACKDNESDTCVQLRERAQEQAQEYVAHGIEMAIQHLEKVKTKTQEAEGLNEETANQIISEIDTEIASLQDILTEVQNAETKEDILAAARKLNQTWNRIRYREMLHAARLVHAKVWSIMKESENLEQRLDAALAELQEQGINVSDIDAKVDEFSSNVASAKEKIEQAEDLFRQAHDLRADNSTEQETINSLTQEAKELVSQAHQELKDAHKLLVEIVREIKAAGGDLTAETSDPDEGLGAEETYEIVEEGQTEG